SSPIAPLRPCCTSISASKRDGKRQRRISSSAVEKSLSILTLSRPDLLFAVVRGLSAARSSLASRPRPPRLSKVYLVSDSLGRELPAKPRGSLLRSDPCSGPPPASSGSGHQAMQPSPEARQHPFRPRCALRAGSRALRLGRRDSQSHRASS